MIRCAELLFFSLVQLGAIFIPHVRSYVVHAGYPSALGQLAGLASRLYLGHSIPESSPDLSTLHRRRARRGYAKG